MYCKDCLYYEPSISKSNGLLQWGYCNNENIDGNADDECTKSENWPLKFGENSDQLRISSSDPALIEVGCNFGCIHFKQK